MSIEKLGLDLFVSHTSIPVKIFANFLKTCLLISIWVVLCCTHVGIVLSYNGQLGAPFLVEKKCLHYSALVICATMV